MQRTALLAAHLLGALSLLGVSACPVEPEHVTVLVVDASGAPVPEVLVIRGEAMEELAYTDAGGEVTFGDVGPEQPLTVAWRYQVDLESAWDRDYAELRTFTGLTPGQRLTVVRTLRAQPTPPAPLVFGEITGFDDAHPEDGWAVHSLDPNGPDYTALGLAFATPQAFELQASGAPGSRLMAGQYPLNDAGEIIPNGIPRRMGLAPLDPGAFADLSLDIPFDRAIALTPSGVDADATHTWHDYTLLQGDDALFLSNPDLPAEDPGAWSLRMPLSLEPFGEGARIQIRTITLGDDRTQIAAETFDGVQDVSAALPPVPALGADADLLHGGDLRGLSLEVAGAEEGVALRGALVYAHWPTEGGVSHRTFWLVNQLKENGAIRFPEVPDFALSLPEGPEENVSVSLQADGFTGDDATIDAWLGGETTTPDAYGIGTQTVRDVYGPLFGDAKVRAGLGHRKGEPTLPRDPAF